MAEKKENQSEELTVGQIFINARTNGRRKRELSTIARQLCVREEFLEALESGEYEKIPELVYILGFARNYAIELGLDPKEIIQKVKAELKLNASDDDDEDVDAITDAEFAPDVKRCLPISANVSAGRAGGFFRKKWTWIISAIVLIIVAVFVVLSIPSDETQQPQNVIVNEVQGAAAVESGISFTRPVRESFGTDNQNSAIVMQAVQETWVKVEDARGETLFSRVLVPGDVYYAPIGTRATLGNAGGIDVWVNGVLIPKLGPVNTRKSGILLTADALLSK